MEALKNLTSLPSRKYKSPDVFEDIVIVVADEVFRNSIEPSAGIILTPCAIYISSVQQQVY